MIDKIIHLLESLKKTTLEWFLGGTYLVVPFTRFLLSLVLFLLTVLRVRNIWWWTILLLIILGGIIVWWLYKLFSRFNRHIPSIVHIFVLPIVVGYLFLNTYVISSKDLIEYLVQDVTGLGDSTYLSIWLLIIGWLLFLYPLLTLFYRIKNTSFESRLQSRIHSRALWFQIVSIMVIGFTFFISILGEGIEWGRGVLLLFPTFLITLYYHLRARAISKSWHGPVWLGCILCGVILLPNLSSIYTQKQYNDFSTTVANQWHNAQSHEGLDYKALSRVYLDIFNKNNNADTKEFQKVFDTTPELFYGDKLNESRQRWNIRSNATNASNVWEKANVILKLAEIESKILTSWEELPLVESTYSFHLTNTVNTNEEVVIYFEAPSIYSVISDLTLWLNGEMKGQIAPRGAAKKVYADALRTNKDPALLEKLWLNTYSLRVFPIPWKNTDAQWRQLVTVKLLSPIVEDQVSISYAPKFQFINLKYDKESRMLSKVFNNKNLIQEDSVKGGDIEEYFEETHELSADSLNISQNTKDLFDYCIPKDLVSTVGGYPRLISLANYYNINYDIENTAIFFDNSLSVKRNNVQTFYDEIFSSIKNYDWTLQDVDLYSFNHMVEKIAEVEDISYRGHSDTDSVLDYIEKNKITNHRIVIVTDDDTYNFSTQEQTWRNLELLLSNQISVYKIWEWIKTFKSDFNNLLAASRGDISQIDSKEDISEIVRKTLDPTFLTFDVIEECESESVDNSSIHKVMAWYVWSLLLWLVDDDNAWKFVAEMQTKLAKKYSIANQFNAYIALETDRQQRDLDRYAQWSDAYKSDYDNFESKKSLWSERNTWGRFSNNFNNRFAGVLEDSVSAWETEDFAFVWDFAVWNRLEKSLDISWASAENIQVIWSGLAQNDWFSFIDLIRWLISWTLGLFVSLIQWIFSVRILKRWMFGE